MVSSVPARSSTGLHGNHMPPPPEYAVVPPNFSVASTRMTSSPSRAAVYAPVTPPAPEPATRTSHSSVQSTSAVVFNRFPLTDTVRAVPGELGVERLDVGVIIR